MKFLVQNVSNTKLINAKWAPNCMAGLPILYSTRINDNIMDCDGSHQWLVFGMGSLSLNSISWTFSGGLLS